MSSPNLSLDSERAAFADSYRPLLYGCNAQCQALSRIPRSQRAQWKPCIDAHFQTILKLRDSRDYKVYNIRNMVDCCQRVCFSGCTLLPPHFIKTVPLLSADFNLCVVLFSQPTFVFMRKSIFRRTAATNRETYANPMSLFSHSFRVFKGCIVKPQKKYVDEHLNADQTLLLEGSSGQQLLWDR